MRISDWSSDVCSSDLPIFREEVAILGRIGQQCANFLSHRLKSPANHRREPVVIESETLIRVGIEVRPEEHTSELQSLMRISYAVFCLKKKSKLILNDKRNNQYRLKRHNRI